MAIGTVRRFLSGLKVGEILDRSQSVLFNKEIFPPRADLIEQLSAAIEADPDFPWPSQIHTHFIYDGSGLDARMLASAMLRRLADDVPVERVVSDALDIIMSESVLHVYAVGITGVNFSRPQNLENGIAIVPRDNMPPSALRQTLFGTLADGGRGPTYNTNQGVSCAVVIRRRRRFCYGPDQDPQHDQEELRRYFDKVIQCVIDAATINSGGAAFRRVHA